MEWRWVVIAAWAGREDNETIGMYRSFKAARKAVIKRCPRVADGGYHHWYKGRRVYCWDAAPQYGHYQQSSIFAYRVRVTRSSLDTYKSCGGIDQDVQKMCEALERQVMGWQDA